MVPGLQSFLYLEGPMSKGKVREAMRIPSHSRLEAEVPPSLSFPHPSSRSKELVMDEPWNLGLSQRGNCSQIRKKKAMNSWRRRINIYYVQLLKCRGLCMDHSWSYIWRMEGPELKSLAHLLGQCSFHCALAVLELGILISPCLMILFWRKLRTYRKSFELGVAKSDSAT